MKIVAFSINPLYADRVMGGAPKQLQQIVQHLGALGHRVTVLCTASSEQPAPFRWSENVKVLPILRFKLPFPQPYDTPAYYLAAAIQIIAERRRTPPATLAYLREHYGVQRQVAAYADAIVDAQPRGPLAYRYQPADDDTRYRLAPWCYRWEGGFYHDFRAEHCSIEPLVALLNRFGSTWSAAQARSASVDGALLERWLREGYIVPQP